MSDNNPEYMQHCKITRSGKLKPVGKIHKNPEYNVDAVLPDGSLGTIPLSTITKSFGGEADSNKKSQDGQDLSEEAFAEYATNFFDDVIMKTLTFKGKQYSGDKSTNALVNFLEGAKVMNTSPQSYLLTVATKHWLSLGLWASGKSQQNVAGIVERCKDVIIYMLLLIWMLDTDQVE